MQNSKSSFNCLLIHTPNLSQNSDGTLFSEVNFCAMGLFSLAGEIKKEGFNVEIIHLGIEKYLDKNFSLASYVKENNIKYQKQYYREWTREPALRLHSNLLI